LGLATGLWYFQNITVPFYAEIGSQKSLRWNSGKTVEIYPGISLPAGPVRFWSTAPFVAATLFGQSVTLAGGYIGPPPLQFATLMFDSAWLGMNIGERTKGTEIAQQFARTELASGIRHWTQIIDDEVHEFGSRFGRLA